MIGIVDGVKTVCGIMTVLVEHVAECCAEHDAWTFTVCGRFGEFGDMRGVGADIWLGNEQMSSACNAGHDTEVIAYEREDGRGIGAVLCSLRRKKLENRGSETRKSIGSSH